MSTIPSPSAAATGLRAAKRAAGNGRRLAELLGITPSAVSRWGRAVPLGRVVAVEAATGVPRYLLRPDLFDAPSLRGALHRGASPGAACGGTPSLPPPQGAAPVTSPGAAPSVPPPLPPKPLLSAGERG